jgi:hypothetical protein
MRRFTTFMRCLPLLIIAACGDNARALPDAGSGTPLPDAPLPDAPPNEMPGPLERLDWRTMRGAPIATSAVTLPSASMFAISGDGFVTQSECQNAPGCALTWRDLAGTQGTRRDHMGRVTSIAISPDGRRTQLVALDAIESCNDGQGIFPVFRGALQLLDLATGEASFELPLRSNTWSTQGFTPRGDWFFAAPLEGTACNSSTTGFLSTTSPFAPPPGLDATDEFVQAVDARRWLVQRSGASLGLTDPLTPGSFHSLSGNDPDPFFDVTQGWVHVYQGFADLVEDVVSITPTGSMRQTTVMADEDWHRFGARGRWIRVCGLPKAEGYRNCRMIDAQGEIAPANFRITFALTRSDDAVQLNSGSIVFVGPTADGSPAVQRLEFATGRLEILHPGDGTLRPVGDGAAAVLLQSGAAWLIEARHEELVAQNVSQVVLAPQLLALSLGRGPGRQDDLAALVSSSGAGQFTLAVLDVRKRRLATVTDSLYFTPPPGPPGSTTLAFNFSDGCGQPWTTRNGGSVLEGFFQEPQRLFFVEQGTPATLWLLPTDLSAPPRRLAELAGNPALCHAPLASPDGRRLGFAEDSADRTTTKITLSSEP